ncbi:hypothetical protein ACFX14_039564 [Malus domestica]
MATVPGQLIWEIVMKNNSFLAREFGCGNTGVHFSKDTSNRRPPSISQAQKSIDRLISLAAQRPILLPSSSIPKRQDNVILFNNQSLVAQILPCSYFSKAS